MDKVELSNELQQRLVTVLDYLGDTAKHGADLAAKELPEVAREVVLLGIIRGWLGVVVALALLAVSFGCWRYALAAWGRNREKKLRVWESDAEDPVHFVVGGAVSCLVGVGVIVASASTAITATFAPRVYLIEWVADKVK